MLANSSNPMLPLLSSSTASHMLWSTLAPNCTQCIGNYSEAPRRALGQRTRAIPARHESIRERPRRGPSLRGSRLPWSQKRLGRAVPRPFQLPREGRGKRLETMQLATSAQRTPASVCARRLSCSLRMPHVLLPLHVACGICK